MLTKWKLRKEKATQMCKETKPKYVDGNTPLHIALKNSCTLETLDDLLKEDPDSELLNIDEENALHCAIAGGCTLPVVEKLIECNRTLILGRDRLGLTPLLKAASTKSAHQYIPLLMKYEKLEEQNTFNRALCLALESGCLERTLNFMLAAGADISTESGGHKNALHCALRGRCHVTVIKRILQVKEDLIYGQTSYGINPLHTALSYGCDQDVYQTLIQTKVDFFAVTNSGQSALHFAASGGCNTKILNDIMSKDPTSIHQQSVMGRIPLHYANKWWVIWTLLQAGSSFDTVDINGDNPLQYLLQNKHVESSAVKMYLQLRSQFPFALDSVTESGDSYLHIAVNSNCDPTVIRALIKAGCDPAQRNKLDKNVFHCAINEENEPQSKVYLKEILRGNPSLIEKCYESFLHMIEEIKSVNICREIVKWILLQEQDVTRPFFYMHRFEDYTSIKLDSCAFELVRLKRLKVNQNLSLFDLVKKCYVSPEYINKLRIYEQYKGALDFSGNFFRIFRDEVEEIVQMIRTCQSLSYKRLPITMGGKYTYLNNDIYQNILNYLNLEDLQQFCLALNL